MSAPPSPALSEESPEVQALVAQAKVFLTAQRRAQMHVVRRQA
jgi:hypothetical protein